MKRFLELAIVAIAVAACADVSTAPQTPTTDALTPSRAAPINVSAGCSEGQGNDQVQAIVDVLHQLHDDAIPKDVRTSLDRHLVAARVARAKDQTGTAILELMALRADVRQKVAAGATANTLLSAARCAIEAFAPILTAGESASEVAAVLQGYGLNVQETLDLLLMEAYGAVDIASALKDVYGQNADQVAALLK